MDDNPLVTWPMARKYREAHEALDGLSGPNDLAPQPGAIADVVDDLERLVESARQEAAANIGPTFGWRGPRTDDSYPLTTFQLDLDYGEHDDPVGISPSGDWSSSALALAARAYYDDSPWDFAPDDSGIWMITVQPYRHAGSGDNLCWAGTIVAFVILRADHDDAYETLAHVWTAKQWRRRGLASSLVNLARERFPVRRVDDVTERGQALLEATAPDLLRGDNASDGGG